MSENERNPKELCHWADQQAAKIIKERGDLSLYTCASGITPSGTVHIGNFREIITVDLIVRALRDRGKNVRFIYSWDDYDVFRKVPGNMPKPEVLEKYLRYPITLVPDTFDRDENYARHHEKDIENELPRVGIHPEFLYQASRYRSSRYAEGMKKALQNKDLIKWCLNCYRDDEHKMKDSDVYWPIAAFCSKCNKDETEIVSYDGEYGVTYKCKACGNEETVDLRSCGNIKLGWRVDWPMRWNEEKVVFEPGGKDHISPGGSYDTAKLVSKKVYGWDAPVTMKYDFVKLKGVPGKMSSSKGKVISLVDALTVYQPEVLRYIFAVNKVDHEFSISFDLDVITMYEAYDRTERIAWGIDKAKSDNLLLQEKRVYELSQIDGMPSVMPYQVPFRQLTTLLQTYSGNIDAVIKSLGDVKSEQEACLRRRCECAWYWVTECAPEDFKFALRTDGSKAEDITGTMLDAVKKVRDQIVPKVGTYATDKDCQQEMYDLATSLGLESK
ncbi:MAG: lysine--tRNA ligase, partial [Treponema sp.]|nr:lysine--tRNA ligase [Treponema sp.]